nr:RNA-directed DNA polymerase, eukaryota [Tanacetum cinerariifolium]
MSTIDNPSYCIHERKIDNEGGCFVSSMARGRSGGLISMWDPNTFVKNDIWCDDSFIIVKGKWKNLDGDYFMINIYGPQDPSDKGILWRRIEDFIHHNNGAFVLFGDFNEVRSNFERLGSTFSPSQADNFNTFITNNGLNEFFNSWFNRDDFDDFLSTKWNSLGQGSSNQNLLFHDKLKGLKFKIKAWLREAKSNERNHMEKFVAELNNIDIKIDSNSASDEERESHSKLLHEIDKLDRLDSLDLQQKSRIKWDTEGDENSKFFHGIVNQRRRTIYIHGIIREEDHNLLEKEVTIDEIKSAEFVIKFFESKKMPAGFNSSFITLIPKVSNPIHVKDYRPISLNSTHYKIIAKILANCLSKVVDKIISQEQSAFISGRQILDGPLMLSEMIEWYEKRKKKMLIFKVNFEKAFDIVSWKYLDFVLHKLGFGLTWRAWIKACLNYSRTSILVNGSPTSEFSVKHDLRQGDPLSPLLFIIAMKGLHMSLEEACHSSLIHRIKIGSSNVTLSHMFYVDDIVITTDWNPLDMKNIIRILHVFYLASGLKINIHKSNIYGVGVTDIEVQSMSNNTGCSPGAFPFIYLGLHIGANLNLSVIKALHGQEGGFNVNVSSSNGVWSKIVRSSNFMHSNTIIPNDFFRSFMGARNAAHLCDLTTEITPFELSIDRDVCFWNLSSDGLFSVSSARQVIDSHLLPFLDIKTQWEKCINW